MVFLWFSHWFVPFLLGIPALTASQSPELPDPRAASPSRCPATRLPAPGEKSLTKCCDKMGPSVEYQKTMAAMELIPCHPVSCHFFTASSSLCEKWLLHARFFIYGAVARLAPVRFDWCSIIPSIEFIAIQFNIGSVNSQWSNCHII